MSEAGAVAARISYCGPQDVASQQQPAAHLDAATAISAGGAVAFQHSAEGPAQPSQYHQGSEGGQASQHNEDAEEWFYDYSNGGPCFDVEGGSENQEASSQITVLAQYHDIGNATSAVACPVGRGQAVLCGTHPELAPHWLGTADAPLDRQSASGQVQCIGNALTVKQKLQQTEAQRLQFWSRLLCACGLREYLV